VAILIARHGETDSNAARVVQVPAAELSARGVRQAERLAERVGGLGVSRILTSDHERARATAERVAVLTRVPLEIDPLLRERDFGDVRGTPYAQLEVDIFAPGYAPPGGETWEAFFERVERAWERVSAAAESSGGNLCVVTHGLVCGVLAERHLRLPEGAEPPRGWANASLTIAEDSAPWRVRVLNCVEHLTAVEGAPPPDAVA
jgi:probable phosphoglycerate mutase